MNWLTVLYDAGFALLVATNMRILLIDKKPLNNLTVEDLRFDMISEIDYGHQLIGASINVSTGSKNLRFRSYNKQRLRKLITHVQHCMAELKQKSNNHQEDQKQHLEQINQQLQNYLQAQHKQQLEMQSAMQNGQAPTATPPPPVLSPQLADYLYAQSLLSQNKDTREQADLKSLEQANSVQQHLTAPSHPPEQSVKIGAQELYQEGVDEIFGKKNLTSTANQPATHQPTQY